MAHFNLTVFPVTEVARNNRNNQFYILKLSSYLQFIVLLIDITFFETLTYFSKTKFQFNPEIISDNVESRRKSEALDNGKVNVLFLWKNVEFTR